MDNAMLTAAAPIRPETLARLKAVIFDPRRCVNAAAALRAAASFLGRPSLSSEDLPALDEASASSLADALERGYPDKGAAARRSIEERFDRP